MPKIVFIVPYRNREFEKIHFSVYMKYLMEDYHRDDYEIYYSHQMDGRPFNRGATKNIGFLALKAKYPDAYKDMTFVFNDVDTVPVRKNMLDYKTVKGTVKHFYGFTFALGGIFSIVGADFELCNGFPNNWGWGLEDNAMNNRVLKNNLVIDRSGFYPIHAREIIQVHGSVHRLINNKEPSNYKGDKMVDNLDKIRDLEYMIEREDDKGQEYSINIRAFKTLIDPDSQIFYMQNIQKNVHLIPNLVEKTANAKRWAMF